MKRAVSLLLTLCLLIEPSVALLPKEKALQPSHLAPFSAIAIPLPHPVVAKFDRWVNPLLNLEAWQGVALVATITIAVAWNVWFQNHSLFFLIPLGLGELILLVKTFQENGFLGPIKKAPIQTLFPTALGLYSTIEATPFVMDSLSDYLFTSYFLHHISGILTFFILRRLYLSLINGLSLLIKLIQF